jgi:hypothetical protein
MEGYIYAGDDPVNSVDPTGTINEDPGCGGTWDLRCEQGGRGATFHPNKKAVLLTQACIGGGGAGLGFLNKFAPLPLRTILSQASAAVLGCIYNAALANKYGAGPLKNPGGKGANPEP